MYEARIKELREQAGRALQVAREAGKQLGAAEGAPPADVQERFDKAKADFETKLAEIRRLEGLEAVEREAEIFTRPVTRVPVAGPGGGDPQVTEAFKRAHHAAQLAYLRQGAYAATEVLREAAVPPEMISVIVRGTGPAEKHLLLGSQADLGGFLVPEDFRAQVLSDLPAASVFRRLVRVERTGRSALVFPAFQSATGAAASIYPSGFKGKFRREGTTSGGTAPVTQDQPKLRQVRIPVHTWQPDAVELTVELLEDSAANLDGILAELIVQTLALDLDDKGLRGTGVDEPEGILAVAAGVAEVNSGAAAALTYDGLVTVFTKLPAQYRRNTTWLMSSDAYGAILKLKDTTNMPIITPNTTPGTLWTRPLEFSEFMDAVAANKQPIIFGDFRQYIVAERADLRIQRLEERFAPNIGVLPSARLGGQVVVKDGFRIQKVAA